MGNGIFMPLALQWFGLDTRYAYIYMATFDKEALYKSTLKPHTYYRYLDDIFRV